MYSTNLTDFQCEGIAIFFDLKRKRLPALSTKITSMKKQYTFLFLAFFLLIWANITCAQTFSKLYDLGHQTQDFERADDDLYAAIYHICPSGENTSAACTLLARFDHFGNLLQTALLDTVSMEGFDRLTIQGQDVIVLDGVNSETSAFEFGTKWTYEQVSATFPFIRKPLTYEITGQTLLNDTVAYVIEASENFDPEYMYIQGDSVYFWDRASSSFRLNFDFSATQEYATDWTSVCFGVGPYNAAISVDSLREETIGNTVLGVQYLQATGDGMQALPAKVYRGVGNAFRLKYGLGEDCDQNWYVTQLRCFEDADNSYNFVGYPCDTTFLITSTEEAPTDIDGITLFPNPCFGELSVRSQAGAIQDYRLYDALGRLQQQGAPPQDGTLWIDKSGLYLLVLRLENDTVKIYKVVVAR